ncbi:hypothetical protein PFISCL1PPCAC_849, partial [Pristionchus fissidentatus]
QILFLLLLGTVVLQAGSDRSIDWKRCVDDAKCFIEGKCIKGAATDERRYYRLHLIDSDEYIIAGNCSNGVQIIPLSKTKILIYMQVIGEQMKTETIGLYQN